VKKLFRWRHFNVILHALVWSIILLFPYAVGSANNQYKIGPHPGFYFTLAGVVHMPTFYLNAHLLFPKLLNRTYWLLYVVCIVLLVFFSYCAKLYILDILFPEAEKEARLHVLFFSVLVFIASVFYRVTIDKIHAERLAKEVETMQLAGELKFLRSQISPHFIFNVFTNLVYLARKKSDKLEASLLMLSGLMRYMLYDAGKKISFQQEMEYLENYVALQKLRFERDVKITFRIDLPTEEKKYSIEPMLLIPFVENAFKHGTGYAHEPTIDLHLKITGGVLVFQVKNKFSQESATSKDESSGIGLNNVRARLSLLYPGKHNLTIDANNNLFFIDLTLNLV